MNSNVLQKQRRSLRWQARFQPFNTLREFGNGGDNCYKTGTKDVAPLARVQVFFFFFRAGEQIKKEGKCLISIS